MAPRTADHPTSTSPLGAARSSVAPGSDADDDVVLFDTEKLRQASRLARRSVIRHPVTAFAGVALVLGAGSVSWLAAPLTYQSTAVLSARSDVVSSAIANPGRAVPQGSDQPLANARETILSEANIDRIIDDADLIERAQAHAGETALGEFRRSVFDAAGLGTTSDDLREDLRRELREALMVQIDGGSNGPDRLTISVFWTDAEDASAIVTAAQENFLEDRHIADLGPIEAALTILERYKADADAEVARLREELDFPSTETRDLPDGSPLRSALQTQSDLEDRLNGARIEVDAAEAAFQYRYSVVQTPEVPLGPVSSMAKRVVMTAGLAVAAAVGFAMARATFRKRTVDAGAGSQPLDPRDEHHADVPAAGTKTDTKTDTIAETDTPVRNDADRRGEGSVHPEPAPPLVARRTVGATASRPAPNEVSLAELVDALLDDGADELHRPANSVFESPAPPKLPMSPRAAQRVSSATPVSAGPPWQRTIAGRPGDPTAGSR